MQEIFHDSSAAKVKHHKAMIQKFLDRGYLIRSEDTDSEEGVHGELIERLHTTILEPSDKNSELPLIKFEAKEIFGRYDWEEEAFDEWENTSFRVMAFRKSSDIRHHNEAWQAFDIPE